MKKIVCSLFLFLPILSVAKPVKSLEQAVSKVKQSIVKNKLTTLPLSCLNFTSSDDDLFYTIEVSALANKKCASYQLPLTSFSYTVNKTSGRLKTTAIATPCYINKIGNQLHYCQGNMGEYLVPIDPVSPIIIYK